MAGVGYTLMTEQAGPKDLVRWAARAEDVGFDLLVSSDHYFPWLDAAAGAGRGTEPEQDRFFDAAPELITAG